jgi:hypothetical protein
MPEVTLLNEALCRTVTGWSPGARKAGRCHELAMGRSDECLLTVTIRAGMLSWRPRPKG